MTIQIPIEQKGPRVSSFNETMYDNTSFNGVMYDVIPKYTSLGNAEFEYEGEIASYKSLSSVDVEGGVWRGGFPTQNRSLCVGVCNAARVNTGKDEGQPALSSS